MSTGQGHSVTTCVRPQEHCHSDLGRFGCTDLSMQCSPTACPTMQVADAHRCVRCTRRSHPAARTRPQTSRCAGGNCSPRGPMIRRVAHPSAHPSTHASPHTPRVSCKWSCAPSRPIAPVWPFRFVCRRIASLHGERIKIKMKMNFCAQSSQNENKFELF